MHEGDQLAFLKAAADGVYVLPEGQRRLAAWIHQCQAAEYQRQQHEAAGALDHVQIDLLTPDAALNAEAAANAALTTVLAFDPLNTLSAPEQHLADFYDVEALRTRAEQSKQVKRTRVAEEYLHDYHYAVAEGHFQPSWYQQAVVFAWGLLVPNTGPRRVVEYADGTVSVELAAEPDTGFLAGQASSMAGMGVAAGSAKTLAGKMAIAGRELLEEGIESAIQYVSGLPIPLVRPSRGSTRPRVESGKVPEVEVPNRTVGRPSPRQSEIDVSGLNPNHRPQVSFSNEREVPYGSRGSVRPDNFRVGEALEVKNYDLLQPSNRANLYNTIHRQYLQRISNLPKGTHQKIVIDIRGQNVPESILMRVRSNILTITRTPNVTVEFLR